MEQGKKKMSTKKFTVIWSSVLAVVLVLAIAVNILMNIFSGYVDLYLGKGDMVITKTENSEDWDSEYYSLDYDSKTEVVNAANALVERIEGEGIVLLKNNGALPLAAPANVTLLGRTAADPVYGGTGSGSVSLDSVVDMKSGLERAGYRINETVYNALSGFASYTMETTVLGPERRYTNPRANIAMDDPASNSFYIGEMPVSGYDEAARSSFTAFGDAAIVVIGRGGGEGGDLTTDMRGWDDNYTDGQHQLELNKDEKDMIALAQANFDTVIVVLNSSNAMELGELESNDAIDAILWIGSPGQTGFYAVGDVLCGNLSPSGRTVDIYPSDFTKDPTFVNFGNYQYSNLSSANASGDGYFVQYEEGIYVGYRYYETAAVEGFLNYDEAVVYPFGYGLSYTDFSWEVTGEQLGDTNGEIAVDVLVTNTGAAAGKEVVQLYFAPPYTPGGIEKPAVVLGDFAKTGLLQPGESETVTLRLPVEDMAAYDYKLNKAYVLERGTYELRIQSDSHTVKEGCAPIAYQVGATVVYSGDDHRPSDRVAVTNQFDDVSAMFTDSRTDGYATNMSRADFAGTFPTAPAVGDMTANDDIIAGYQAYSVSANLDPDAVMPATGADNGINLIDMRGLPFDDDSWSLILDQLTAESMRKLIMNGAYTTGAIPSIGKPATNDFDGPSGITSYMTSLSCTSYPSEVVVASSYNVALAREMGVMVGNEALANKVNGWYAPGVNLHRNQFAGRNFEYYSEDPLVSGKIGAACVEGAASKGVYSTVKHFALNDQETNRVNNGVSVWANEQAMRELYLKPFEYIVKNSAQSLKYISDDMGTVSEVELSGATAIMSSFNRIGTIWGGGSAPLLQHVLRGEWGFDGLVITDFNLYTYMYPDQGIACGSDLMLTYESMKTMEDVSSATAVGNMRKAAHSILYTIANSNAMNGIAPGTIITYTKAPWETGLLVGDAIVGVLLVAGVVMILRRRKKFSK